MLPNSGPSAPERKHRHYEHPELSEHQSLEKSQDRRKRDCVILYTTLIIQRDPVHILKSPFKQHIPTRAAVPKNQSK